MRFSNRLKALYDAVEKGESAADIGTDHGYVPLMLIRNGISPRVILSDISEGSLAKARENFAVTGVSIPEADFRIGDGLSSIRPGEVDDVIIGGLGGQTIIHILEADPEKTRSFRKLILQPRNSCGELRCFLYCSGFDIANESLSSEGKFICEVITAVRSSGDHREPPFDQHDIRWKYPEEFVYCDPDLLEMRIRWKAGRLSEQIDSLKKSRTDQSERIRLLADQRKYLLELMRKNKEFNGKNS